MSRPENARAGAIKSSITDCAAMQVLRHRPISGVEPAGSLTVPARLVATVGSVREDTGGFGSPIDWPGGVRMSLSEIPSQEGFLRLPRRA